MTGTSGRDRVMRIAIATALMAAAVFVVGQGLRQANAPASLPLTGAGDTPSIPTESGVFRLAERALDYQDSPPTPDGGRSLETFYSRRAYPGAPPVIPHEALDPSSYGGALCLACHGDGGWVEQFGAYAPVTPHAEFESCAQCHVASSGVRPFRSNRFEALSGPPIQQAALPGAPPPIPHSLQLRDNCLACHAGPAAVSEIRVTHPERVNCRQCHALAAGASVFSRAPRRP